MSDVGGHEERIRESYEQLVGATFAGVYIGNFDYNVLKIWRVIEVPHPSSDLKKILESIFDDYGKPNCGKEKIWKGFTPGYRFYVHISKKTVELLQLLSQEYTYEITSAEIFGTDEKWIDTGNYHWKRGVKLSLYPTTEDLIDKCYSRLTGNCFYGIYEGTFEMDEKTWHVFLLQDTEDELKAALDNTLKVFEDHDKIRREIWKGFHRSGSTYKFYAQVEIKDLKDLKDKVVWYMIKEFEIFEGEFKGWRDKNDIEKGVKITLELK